jgi:alpha-1,6-mannosyltransferase
MGDTRRVYWLLGLGVLGGPVYAFNFGLTGLFSRAHLISGGGDPYRSFLCQVLFLALLYLTALALVFRSGADAGRSRRGLWVILFFACLYRWLLVPSVPALSTDIYRYIWDGRVQAHGINPYVYPPRSEALKDLRDEKIYPRINRPSAPTIYPAGAQLLFHGLNRLVIRSTTAFKAAVVVSDMGSLLVLTLMLIHLKVPAERVLVYAWHPLVIYEVANNGHLDGFMLLFVLLALFLMLKSRPAAAIASLALATAVKLYPVLLLPTLLKSRQWRYCLLFGGIVLALYLPYLSAGPAILGFLPEYFRNPAEGFNLGLKAYLLKILPLADHLLITLGFAVLLAAAVVVVWRLPKDDITALKCAYLLVGLQLLLASGSLHPWYLIPIIPFLALFPSPAWLYFSFAVALSYLTYLSGEYRMPEWVRHVEYVPLFVLLIPEYLAMLRPSHGWCPWRPAA